MDMLMHVMWWGFVAGCAVAAFVAPILMVAEAFSMLWGKRDG